MAAADPNQFQELLRMRRSGVDPALIRALGPEGAKRALEAGYTTKDLLQSGAQATGQGFKTVTKRPGMAGTLGTAGVLGVGNLMQGDVLGAAASTLGGLAGGGAGSAIAGLIPGPIGVAARFALPALGALAGGMGAEQAAAGLAGKSEQAAQRPGAGPDVSLGGIPLTETAALRQQREFDRAQTLQDIQQVGGAELALSKELYNFMATKEIENQKAMAPIIERAQRSQLTNAQAMLASQTAAYQQLGRSAMIGKLAGIQAQERGATMRQALASNPYAGSVMQAPQISFG
jgi:hypothetical protein